MFVYFKKTKNYIFDNVEKLSFYLRSSLNDELKRFSVDKILEKILIWNL